MINVGDKIPAVDVTVVDANGQAAANTESFFSGKKIVVFAVPGAFTPTCSEAHFPGYVAKAAEIKAKGVDLIACLSVNDGFVMDAWKKAQNTDEVVMIADGGALFTKALGLEMDTSGFGGLRSQRFAMVVDNAEVKVLHVEAPQAFEVSKAEAILDVL